jgi:gamma-glutamyltranspeptidase
MSNPLCRCFQPALVCLVLIAGQAAAEPLALHPENPHYFVFRGKPTVLVTSGEHYGAVLNSDFDYAKYLETLAADKLNLTRTFPGCYVEPEKSFNIERNTLAPAAGKLICPWARSSEPGYVHGGNKFDLTKWDEAFFNRLHDFVARADKLGIVVEMNLFTPMYEDPMWNYSPMKSANNVNGIGKVGKHEVYTLDKEPALLAVQEAMTRKIVTELNAFDNLYYEICNEPYFGGVTRAWHDRITDVIVETEKPLPKKHLISWNVANDTAKVHDPHPGISIFNFHYAKTSAVSDNYALNKVLGLNETGFKGTADDFYRMQAWEFLLAGGGLYNNLDYSFCVGHEDGTLLVKDPTPGGGGPAFRKQLRVLKQFLESFEFARLKPAGELVKGGVPKDVTAYALVEPREQYAVYLRQAPAENLQLDLPKGTYEGSWLDPVTGEATAIVAFRHTGGLATLSPPKVAKDLALRLVGLDESLPLSEGTGTQGAVSAGGAGAVAAGLELLKRGGNAADAGAATILALSVTDSGGFCFGGEVPIIVYDARRRVVEVIAGMGTAPRLATRAYFDRPEGIPAKGIESAAVPAAFDACITLLDRHGTLRLADVAEPALRLLDRGKVEWHPLLARSLRRLIDAESRAGGDRRRGLRLAADYFYRGPIARELAAFCEQNGGLIRYEDLATHTTRIEEPVAVDYRGHTVYKCGAWTQGPYLLQTLRLLEGFDLAGMGHNRPETIHVTLEAMKLALADRDVYYADPLFVEVPLEGLLSRGYADLRRALIDRQHASLEQRPGDPRRGQALLADAEKRFGLGGPVHDTTTCAVADHWGNVVVATPSGWSGVQAGETGIWLGTRLQSFNTWEGHPNCIVPGKRPRITLTPTLVLKEGKPVLAVSVAGGDGQDQAGLQAVLNQIDFGLSAEASMKAVRFGTNHHLGSFRQRPPELGSLLIQPEADDATVAALGKLGHKVTRSKGALWAPSVIRIDPAGIFEAAGDARAGRHAGAY